MNEDFKVIVIFYIFYDQKFKSKYFSPSLSKKGRYVSILISHLRLIMYTLIVYFKLNKTIPVVFFVSVDLFVISTSLLRYSFIYLFLRIFFFSFSSSLDFISPF